MPQRPLTRRGLLASGPALLSIALVRPAGAAPGEMADAIVAFAKAAAIAPGRVRLEAPPLVENGNSVPVTLRADSPMTAADHVVRLALFNEKNPQPEVAVFHLGPRAGRAVVSTRIRLATSQRLVAIAQMSDGSFWSDTVDVTVTIAACTEEL